MSVNVFYNPDLVEHLAACGITARRRLSSGTPPRGFVLGAPGGLPRARGGASITNVVAVLGGVTITGRQLRLPAGRTAELPVITTPIAPQTSLELVEECARLRRDNQRLLDEVARLRAEVNRLTDGPIAHPQHEALELDDSARRFSLIELDL